MSGNNGKKLSSHHTMSEETGISYVYKPTKSYSVKMQVSQNIANTLSYPYQDNSHYKGADAIMSGSLGSKTAHTGEEIKKTFSEWLAMGNEKKTHKEWIDANNTNSTTGANYTYTQENQTSSHQEGDAISIATDSNVSNKQGEQLDNQGTNSVDVKNSVNDTDNSQSETGEKYAHTYESDTSNETKESDQKVDHNTQDLDSSKNIDVSDNQVEETKPTFEQEKPNVVVRTFPKKEDEEQAQREGKNIDQDDNTGKDSSGFSENKQDDINDIDKQESPSNRNTGLEYPPDYGDGFDRETGAYRKEENTSADDKNDTTSSELDQSNQVDNDTSKDELDQKNSQEDHPQDLELQKEEPRELRREGEGDEKDTATGSKTSDYTHESEKTNEEGGADIGKKSGEDDAEGTGSDASEEGEKPNYEVGIPLPESTDADDASKKSEDEEKESGSTKGSSVDDEKEKEGDADDTSDDEENSTSEEEKKKGIFATWKDKYNKRREERRERKEKNREKKEKLRAEKEEDKEKLRLEKKADKERLRLEKKADKEKLRLEKKADKERRRQEAKDRRGGKTYWQRQRDRLRNGTKWAGKNLIVVPSVWGWNQLKNVEWKKGFQSLGKGLKWMGKNALVVPAIWGGTKLRQGAKWTGRNMIAAPIKWTGRKIGQGFRKIRNIRLNPNVSYNPISWAWYGGKETVKTAFSLPANIVAKAMHIVARPQQLLVGDMRGDLAKNTGRGFVNLFRTIGGTVYKPYRQKLPYEDIFKDYGVSMNPAGEKSIGGGLGKGLMWGLRSIPRVPAQVIQGVAHLIGETATGKTDYKHTASAFRKAFSRVYDKSVS